MTTEPKTVSSLDEQIAALQQQRNEELQKQQAEAKRTVEERNRERMQQVQARTIAQTRKLWPSGAVLLERMYDAFNGKQQADEENQALAAQLKSQYQQIAENGKPFGKAQNQFVALEEAAEAAAVKASEADKQFIASDTLGKAFAADHSKQRDSIVKHLAKAESELRELAEIEHVLRHNPRRTSNPKLKFIAGKVSTLIDQIENY